MKIGYFLSCEEYPPAELVEQSVAAERAGFEALWLSHHFHPWNDEQGQSPFVGSVIGALSQVCSLPSYELHDYRDAGFDEVHVANMGPHFREMIEAYGRDVLPTLRSER